MVCGGTFIKFDQVHAREALGQRRRGQVHKLRARDFQVHDRGSGDAPDQGAFWFCCVFAVLACFFAKRGGKHTTQEMRPRGKAQDKAPWRSEGKLYMTRAVHALPHLRHHRRLHKLQPQLFAAISEGFHWPSRRHDGCRANFTVAIICHEPSLLAGHVSAAAGPQPSFHFAL